MKKLFEKRARDYNSEDDFDEEIEISEDENGEITKFIDGCNAFRLAFKKIILNKSASSDDDILGPVLSAHKKLIAEKLAQEEDVERKVMVEAKKEKHLIREKGHMKPANFLDSHEKALIEVSTKGVVKLFNAVNKAQHAQKGLNPSREKDDKAIKKRRREFFFSELGKTPSQTAVSKLNFMQAGASNSPKDEGPSWAPLRDNYMLMTNPKLKDWDMNPGPRTFTIEAKN